LLSDAGAVVRPRELAVFCRDASTLFEAGVPLKDAISILAVQAKGRLLKQALPEVHNRILQGESFAHALAAVKAFPVFMCGFVSVGELTAQLPRVCGQLADYYAGQAKTKDELTAALVYPVAVTLMMLGVIVMAVVLVLPGYSLVFENSGVALPVLTRGLLGVSAFITSHARPLAAGLCALVTGIFIFARNKKGREYIAAAMLRFALFRQGVNLRLVQALNLMLDAGRSVSEAIPVCAEVSGSARIKRDLSGVGNSLAMGRPFWASMEDLPYVDPLLVSLARVGEESGRLPQTMAKCRDYFEEAYQRTLRRFSKLVEPVITLTLGVILILVMLAIVLPTFELATV
jgi:type IV pilus assembly protein PilC